VGADPGNGGNVLIGARLYSSTSTGTSDFCFGGGVFLAPPKVGSFDQGLPMGDSSCKQTAATLTKLSVYIVGSGGDGLQASFQQDFSVHYQYTP